MRITFIGHASLLIEANGLSIVSDPWWNGPCFGAQWWPYPLPYVEAVRDRRVDYVYVSHGHHDHFHPPTLKLFRGSKILVAAGSELAQGIRRLGFEVIECEAEAEAELGSGVRCRIMETYADDTLMAVSANGETCLNLNDSLHACPGGDPAEVLLADPAALRVARLRVLRLRDRLPLPQLQCPAGKGPRSHRGHAPGVLQSRLGEDHPGAGATLRIPLRCGGGVPRRRAVRV